MSSPTTIGVSITGTGLFTPPHSITNAELAASLTESVLAWNAEHAERIAAGHVAARDLPDEEFDAVAVSLFVPAWMESMAPFFARELDELAVTTE